MVTLGRTFGRFHLSPNGLYVPPAPITTTIFNVVTDYGADPTGVVDSAPKIRDAFLDAHANSAGGNHSTIYFPTGTYAVATDWMMPSIKTGNYLQGSSTGTEIIGATQRSGTILLQGNGSTIKFTSGTNRVAFLHAGWPTAYWATYGKFEINNFIFDNNNLFPSGSIGRILWMTGNGNSEDITIRNCTMTANLPTFDHVNLRNVNCIAIHSSRTLADRSSTTNWGFIRNILIEDCNLKSCGRKNISILVDSPVSTVDNGVPMGTNRVLIDNIVVRRTTCDLNHYPGSNIHVGSMGSVRNVTIADCDCTDSTDDGIEINNVNNMHITDCHFYNNNFPIMLTWFSLPPDAATPHLHISGCTYSDPLGDYHLSGANTLNCQPFMVRAPTLETAGTYLYTRSWGDVIIENCDLEYGYAESIVSYRNNFDFHAPWSSVTIQNVNISEPTSARDYINLDCTRGTVTDPLYTLNNIKHTHVKNGILGTIASTDVTVTGTHTMDSDIPGL